MSWYTDPQLFIEKSVTGFQYVQVYRCLKEIGSPVDKYDFEFQESADYSKHFSNLVTDNDILDAFNSTFPNHRDLLVNCEGWVVHKDTLAAPGKRRVWFRVEPNSPFWSLPGLTRKPSEAESESSEKQLALEKTVAELQATIAALKDEAEKQKATSNDEKTYLEETIRDLEADILSLERKQSEAELQPSEKQLALEKTVSELQAMIAALKDEAEKKKSAGKMDPLANDEKIQLEGTIRDLETDILSLDSELEKANDENSALIDELGRGKAEKEDLEKRLLFLEEEKSTLENVKNDLEDKLAVLESDNARLEAKQKELNGDLDAWTREVADVHKQLEREKKDKQALEKIVLDLTSKLEECCGGSTDQEPWLSGYAAPSNWVPFEDLVPGITRKSRPLAIVKRDDMPAFDEDYTTNVKASYFYRGMVNDRVVYPIVVVNVTELTPNGEKAKFDPNVWSLFNNAGTIYAARSPFPAPIRH